MGLRTWVALMLRHVADRIAPFGESPVDVVVQADVDGEDSPIPPQDPLTPQAREMMWRPPPPPLPPQATPPLAGSARARMQAVRGSR